MPNIIQLHLLDNKQVKMEMQGIPLAVENGYKIVAGEENATIFAIKSMPTQYSNATYTVEMVNSKVYGIEETEITDTVEIDGVEYKAFTLPVGMAVAGYGHIVIRAYQDDEIVPFMALPIKVWNTLPNWKDDISTATNAKVEDGYLYVYQNNVWVNIGYVGTGLTYLTDNDDIDNAFATGLYFCATDVSGTKPLESMGTFVLEVEGVGTPASVTQTITYGSQYCYRIATRNIMTYAMEWGDWTVIDLSQGGGSQQVQADWNETDSTEPSFIQNKPPLESLNPSTDNIDTLLDAGFYLMPSNPRYGTTPSFVLSDGFWIEVEGFTTSVPKTVKQTITLGSNYAIRTYNQMSGTGWTAWEEFDLSNFVGRPTSAPSNQFVYGEYSGAAFGSQPVHFTVSNNAIADSIAQRYTDARLKVGTPVDNADATPKAYVDGTITEDTSSTTATVIPSPNNKYGFETELTALTLDFDSITALTSADNKKEFYISFMSGSTATTVTITNTNGNAIFETPTIPANANVEIHGIVNYGKASASDTVGLKWCLKFGVIPYAS